MTFTLTLPFAEVFSTVTLPLVEAWRPLTLPLVEAWRPLTLLLVEAWRAKKHSDTTAEELKTAKDQITKPEPSVRVRVRV